MSENNPFSNPNKDKRHSGGILDIDKIIEEEKIHAHKGAVATPEPVKPVEIIKEEEVIGPQLETNSILKKDTSVEEPKITIPNDLGTNSPLLKNDLEESNQTDDELNLNEDYNENSEEPEPIESVSNWRPPSRRIPRVERSDLTDEPEETEDSNEAFEPTDDIVLNAPKNTPNRRNLWLMIGGVAVIIGLIFLIPQLINNGVIYKSDDTGDTGSSSSDSSNVVAGLSQDVTMKKVSDGLESDDPDKWQITFTADTTDITINVDCTTKPGGGTSPNLSCVDGSNDVVDGTFVKPFTADEGWTYDGEDYGYCFSFADKVSARTVQSDLYGSSGIQLFYMADDFRICSKKAGNPNNVPKNTPCDNQQAYCPAVRLRSIS